MTANASFNARQAAMNKSRYQLTICAYLMREKRDQVQNQWQNDWWLSERCRWWLKINSILSMSRVFLFVYDGFAMSHESSHLTVESLFCICHKKIKNAIKIDVRANRQPFVPESDVTQESTQRQLLFETTMKTRRLRKTCDAPSMHEEKTKNITKPIDIQCDATTSETNFAISNQIIIFAFRRKYKFSYFHCFRIGIFFIFFFSSHFDGAATLTCVARDRKYIAMRVAWPRRLLTQTHSAMVNCDVAQNLNYKTIKCSHKLTCSLLANGAEEWQRCTLFSVGQRL